MAQENDNGKRIDIRAFTTIAGIEHEHWIVCNIFEAMLLAIHYTISLTVR